MSFKFVLLSCAVVGYVFFYAHTFVWLTMTIKIWNNTTSLCCFNSASPLCFSPFPFQTGAIPSTAALKYSLVKAHTIFSRLCGSFVSKGTGKAKRKVEFLQNMIPFDWNQTSISHRSTTSWLLLTSGTMTTEGPAEKGWEQGVRVCVCVLEKKRERDRESQWRVFCGPEHNQADQSVGSYVKETRNHKHTHAQLWMSTHCIRVCFKKLYFSSDCCAKEMVHNTDSYRCWHTMHCWNLLILLCLLPCYITVSSFWMKHAWWIFWRTSGQLLGPQRKLNKWQHTAPSCWTLLVWPFYKEKKIILHLKSTYNFRLGDGWPTRITGER